LIQDYATKTRLVIAGNQFQNEATKLLLHTLEFSGKEIDFITPENSQINGNDFILFQAQNTILNEYHPNIVLITDIQSSIDYSPLLETVVDGGIVIFNEENTELNHLVENASNFFRKIPFNKPETEVSAGEIYVITDLGEIPLQIYSADNISYIDGVKHLAQQLGIMESEFYESLLDFEF